jgi:hypothetical protein
MFDFLTGFVPRKLKDLFRWTEYLYYNSPHIFAALQKLADYIITDITFATDSQTLRSNYEDLLVDKLNIKSHMKACARDRMIYGNVFVSLYLPFKRVVKCDACSAIWDIRHVGKYEYLAKKAIFKFNCPTCGKKASTSLDDVKDIKVKIPGKINVIRWDPKLMDLDHNPVTGQTDYYYNIPEYLRDKIHKGDPSAINGLPKGFLDAARDDKRVFKFQEGKVFHMKIDAPAGIDTAWGFPVLTSSLKQFYYTQVLRKANEAIALDHVVPFRVLHPAQTSGSADPVEKLAMDRWVSETKKNLKQWRRDPLHIMFAPVALGVTQMGGQGRTLLTLGEVKEAEDNIIAGMGIPREFLYGGLSYTGSSVTLRMLENQLLSHAADIQGLLQWTCDQVANYMGWEKVDADITNFKFIDDVQQKSMMMQMNMQYDLMSRRTMAEMYDIDLDEERREKKQEAMDDMKFQDELNRDMQEFQASLSQQAYANSNQGAGLTYDQQAVVAEADMLVEQLLQMDPGMRRSQLHALQEEDLVMYAVVIERMQTMQNQQNQEAKSQVAQEQM